MAEDKKAIKETEDTDITIEEILGNIFDPEPEEDEEKEYDEAFYRGLKNLNQLPDIYDAPPVKGKKFIEGKIGFRRKRNSLLLAIACGKAQVRYLDLIKYIAMIENMHDPETATIMLQNFQDADNQRSARGQVLGRVNPESSAIHVVQGLTGRIIDNPSDIAVFDVYYLDRKDLTSFYLAAKAQGENSDDLETMIATFAEWRTFDVPLDPLNPYGE